MDLWPLVVFYASTRAIARKYEHGEEDDDDNDDDVEVIGRGNRCLAAAQSNGIELMAEKRVFDIDVCHVCELLQHREY